MAVYNIDKCLAKVMWNCPDGGFKQCTRRPQAGNDLCGIHIRQNPHGLINVQAGPEPEATHLALEDGHDAGPDQLDTWKLLGQPGEAESEMHGDIGSVTDYDHDMLDYDDGLEDEVASEEEESNGEVSDCDDGQEATSAAGKGQQPDGAKPLVEQEPRPSAKRTRLNAQGSYQFSLDHVGEHLAVAEAYSKSQVDMGELAKYSDFCTQVLQAPIPEQFKVLVDTSVGPVSLAEGMVQTYLVHMRFGGGPAEGKVLPSGNVSQIVKILKNLQACMRHCGLAPQDVPAWVTSHTKSMTQLIRDFKKADMPTELPTTRRLFVTPEHIESYCISVIIRGKAEMYTSYKEIGEALLLRMQSGRSHRFVNLTSLKLVDTGYKAAASDGESVPFYNICCTKPLGTRTVEGVANARGRVEILVVDPITRYLWDKWMEQTVEQEDDEKEVYFFPKQGKFQFHWDQPMPRVQHDEAVQHCVEALGLPYTKEEIHKFTSKSVRSGVSAQVARVVRESLTGKNKSLGRSATSTMDLGTYCPKEVLMEPGPLFADVESAKARLGEALAKHFAPIKDKLICEVCGYPQCNCPNCNQGRASHTCWLQGRRGRMPKHGPAEDGGQLAMRASAWGQLGIDETPVWKLTKYSW